MPWPKDHKSRARARIVAAAAAALRAKGVSGVGVADVMASAGLTHGGFYAHFPSKEDLLAEAIEHASAQTLAGLGGAGNDASTETRLRAVVDAYLTGVRSPRWAQRSRARAGGCRGICAGPFARGSSGSADLFLLIGAPVGERSRWWGRSPVW